MRTSACAIAAVALDDRDRRSPSPAAHDGIGGGGGWLPALLGSLDDGDAGGASRQLGGRSVEAGSGGATEAKRIPARARALEAMIWRQVPGPEAEGKQSGRRGLTTRAGEHQG
ncbi:hypothetical protein GUJ93_ZPchr0004g39434 [Zizania palustris]|uniref:Uncharacterized protein n=1 Tax=Zizania palustris TaxID=103762 RepID=A0A8J5SFI2_ZIZPA|nr:hypothetical protein GUJ93_ZPchr0004g39434 [Zizania palustris]